MIKIARQRVSAQESFPLISMGHPCKEEAEEEEENNRVVVREGKEGGKEGRTTSAISLSLLPSIAVVVRWVRRWAVL